MLQETAKGRARGPDDSRRGPGFAHQQPANQRGGFSTESPRFFRLPGEPLRGCLTTTVLNATPTPRLPG